MTPKKMNVILKITLALLILVTCAGLYLANIRLSETALKTAQLKAQVQIDEQQLKVYEQTKLQVDELSYANDLAQAVLPAGEDQSAVVAELSEFARRSGLRVAQINFVANQAAQQGAPTQGSANKPATNVPKGVKVVPVLIELEAGSSYTNLLDFLKTIESNRRKTQVTNITLTPDADNRAVLSQVTISLNLYTRQAEGGSQ